jgi:hypothetical protein
MKLSEFKIKHPYNLEKIYLTVGGSWMNNAELSFKMNIYPVPAWRYENFSLRLSRSYK